MVQSNACILDAQQESTSTRHEEEIQMQHKCSCKYRSVRSVQCPRYNRRLYSPQTILVGDLVRLRYSHLETAHDAKFKPRWSVPFTVHAIYGNGTFYPVNGAGDVAYPHVHKDRLLRVTTQPTYDQDLNQNFVLISLIKTSSYQTFLLPRIFLPFLNILFVLLILH